MESADRPLSSEFLTAQTAFLQKLARELARDAQSADDLVQETFVTALEHPPRPETSHRGWRAWLATVLRHRAERRSREAASRRHREREVARSEASECTQDEREERARLQSSLASAVRSLEEPYRSAVVMRWLDGKSVREVARVQGISYDAARQRLSRATSMLRARLDREWNSKHSWVLLVLSPSSLEATVPPRVRVSLRFGAVSGPVAIGALCLALVLVLVVEGHRAPPDAHQSVHAADGASFAVGEDTSRTELTPVDAGGRRTVAFVAPERAEALLEGFVLRPDGTPVEGADIQVLRLESAGYLDLSLSTHPEAHPPPRIVAAGVSDGRGRFGLSLPVGRPYLVEVRAIGYGPARIPNRYAGEQIEVQMARGATIEGRVTSERDGTPIADAIVRISTVPTEDRMSDTPMLVSQRTNADGRYRLSDLPPGPTYLGCVPPTEQWPDSRRFELREGETYTIDFVAGRSGAVRGRVTDASTGRGIVGAEVGMTWAFTRSTFTDSNGEFVLTNFHGVGCHQIAARAEGHGVAVVVVPASPNGDLQDTRVDIVLGAARTVVGRVVDESGLGVGGARVSAVAAQGLAPAQQVDWQTTESDSQGNFRLTNMRRDLVLVLSVRRDSFGSELREIPAPIAGEEVSRLSDIVLAPGRIVRGVVQDIDGHPCADHLVRLHGSHVSASEWWGMDESILDRLAAESPSPLGAYMYLDTREARTDSLGRFAFADVALGQYEVSTRAVGEGRAASAEVHVQPGVDPLPARIVIDAGLVISGFVVDTDHKPRVGARVQACGANGDVLAETETGSGGRFELSGMRAGRYRVVATPLAPDDEGTTFVRSEALDVEAGQRDLQVEVRSVRRLRGTVRRSDGRVVPRARLHCVVHASAEDPFTTECDERGRFRLAVPVRGPVRVTAEDPSSPGGLTGEPRWIDPEEREIEIVLDSR